MQPEIKKIQQKYKDDKTKQNEELLKFYQENKINPLAGCLPLLVDLPDRYRGVRHLLAGVQRHIPQKGTFTLYKDICTPSRSLRLRQGLRGHTRKTTCEPCN